MIILDTQVLLWLRLGSSRLGQSARRRIERAWQNDDVGVSAISFWEVAMLKAKGRLRLDEDVGLWRRQQLEQGIIEIPVDGEIAIRAGLLQGMRGDPADRLLIATALEGHQLVTADQQVLDWPGPLNRLDARE